MLRKLAVPVVVLLLAVAGCTKPAHHHPDWQRLDRQARQAQDREIRPIVRKLCDRGYGVPHLAALCREWHLPLRRS